MSYFRKSASWGGFFEIRSSGVRFLQFTGRLAMTNIDVYNCTGDKMYTVLGKVIRQTEANNNFAWATIQTAKGEMIRNVCIKTQIQ